MIRRLRCATSRRSVAEPTDPRLDHGNGMPDPATIVRRFLLWGLICAVSAAPSFVWAHAQFDRAAMLLGVALFTVGYTVFTCTAAFERFHHRPFVRRTLYIGYGARLIVSVAFPLGMGLDMMPGMLSVSIVQEVLKTDPHSFGGTLATTIVQGTLLNLILFVFMAAVYAIQKLTMKPPEAPPGFEVVMPVIPVEEQARAMPLAPSPSGRGLG
jgi:hypothetical protein